MDMLFILADVYRIATFCAEETPRDRRHVTPSATHRRRNWLRFAGLLR